MIEKLKKILSSPIFGLPLLYIGVLLMLAHFAVSHWFGWSSNIVLVVAICLEIVGAWAHYYKLKH